MKDRFTEASSELTDKNPYICESCEEKYGHPTVEHFTGTAEHELETSGPDCLIFCDPMPFGD